MDHGNGNDDEIGDERSSIFLSESLLYKIYVPRGEGLLCLAHKGFPKIGVGILSLQLCLVLDYMILIPVDECFFLFSF